MLLGKLQQGHTKNQPILLRQMIVAIWQKNLARMQFVCTDGVNNKDWQSQDERTDGRMDWLTDWQFDLIFILQ